MNTLTSLSGLVDEIHDTLLQAGITRTPQEIEFALAEASIEYAHHQKSWAVNPAVLREDSHAWHDLLHQPWGVYDVLDVDVEGDDLVDLVDRMEK